MKRTPPYTLHRSLRPQEFFPALLASLLVSTLLSGNAFSMSVSMGQNTAGTMPKTKLTPAKGSNKNAKKQPVLLTADQIDYDHEQSLVIAQGHVEISQGDTIMLADSVTYDQARDIVMAHGHISILEASGNVVFADDLALQNEMKAGIINQFKARLSDDSLFVAAEGHKYNEDITELHKGVYSPCKVCMDDVGKGTTPLWQIRADRVLIDQKEQEVSYDDARMELYGVPIMYSPYFSHPTPGADNKSGLLEPEFRQSTNLGATLILPVYYSIAPDKDATITPIYTTLEGPVLAGEYRQLFDHGTLDFDGSITQPQDRDAGGDISKGQDYRGHFNANGKFNVEDDYDWGFNVHRVSDDTYLRRYGFGEDTLLTSRVYGEGVNFLGDAGTRSFASVEALQFQGLTAEDNSSTSPLVLPLANFDWESAPQDFNSRFTLNSNAMSFTRDEGSQSRRLSNTFGWKIPFITSDGEVIEVNSSVRGDIYSVDSVPLSNGRNYAGDVGRILPQAAVTWRYPFISTFGSSSIMLEPVIMFAASPNGQNSDKIPNIDSAVPEFNADNLFSPNRYAGYDLVETGPQVSYGLRGQAQLYSDKYIDWLFGQHYHSSNDSGFPFSTDVNSHLSDYVGKFGITYDPVSLAYRYRLDRQTLSPRSNEVDAGYNLYPFTLGGSYLQLKDDPTLQNKQEISGMFALNLDKEWQWQIAGRRDLQLHELTGASTGIIFKNECVDILNTLSKDYTLDRDIKPSTTYLFRVSLKNLD